MSKSNINKNIQETKNINTPENTKCKSISSIDRNDKNLNSTEKVEYISNNNNECIKSSFKDNFEFDESKFKECKQISDDDKDVINLKIN